jgi:hypothetical protein
MSLASNQWHVGIAGCGEAGKIPVEDPRKDGVQIGAHRIMATIKSTK